MRAKIETLYSEFKNIALAKRLRRFISPPFLMMIFASFALWYIAKLGYTYTTEIEVKIKVGDQKVTTTCVVEGVGTNLIGYKIHRGGTINIALPDTKYTLTQLPGDEQEYILIDDDMLSKAISFQYSDIKVISVATPPAIEVSDKIRRIIAED